MQTATVKFMLANINTVFASPTDWEINFCGGKSLSYPSTFAGHYKWHAWSGRIFAKDRRPGAGSIGSFSISCHVRDTKKLNFIISTWKDENTFLYSIENSDKLPEDYDLLDVFDLLKEMGFDIKLQMSYNFIDNKPKEANNANPSIARIPFVDHIGEERLEARRKNLQGFYW